MDLKNLDKIFFEVKEYTEHKFDQFVKYSNKVGLLNSENLKEWISKMEITESIHFKNNYNNFLDFIVSLHTKDINTARLAIRFVKDKKLSLKDIAINKDNPTYLFKKWLKNLPVENVYCSRDSDDDEKRIAKQISNKKNRQFCHFKYLEKDSGKDSLRKGFEVYIIKDKTDFIHIVDHGEYIFKEGKKIYGGSVNTIIDTDFQNNILFNFFRNKKIEFHF